MFTSIFTYELKYWLKKPSTYFYFITFFGIALLLFIGTAGFFDSAESSNPQNVRILNSPFEINYMLKFFNKLFLFLLPTVIGVSIYKDYKDNVHSILYSFPIKKRSYLFSKFISSFLIVSFITFSVGFAFLIGEYFPNLHSSKIGDFNILGYLQAYLLFTIPNIFIYGLLIFSLITYFRNIYTGFGVIIILFFIQSITQNIFGDYPFLIALLDPFAENAVLYETQYWSLADKNSALIPAFGVILYNRIFWTMLSFLIFYFVYQKFQFHEHISSILNKTKKGKSIVKKNFNKVLSVTLPKVNYRFSTYQQLKSSWYLSNFHFKTIVKSWLFYCIAFLGILAVLFAIGKITNDSDLAVLPSTNIILTIPAFFFTTIIMLLTFVYSGMLIHKSRKANMHQINDVTATSNWVFLVSKIIAILKMQVVLLFLLLLTGISIQIFNEYYNFEIDLYLFHLFIIQFSGLIIWASTSIFIHNLFKNTYVGIFILILIWLGVSGIQQFGIDTKLLLFNFEEPLQYSDINGYGSQLIPFLIVKGYWIFFTLLLLIFSYLLWFRGFYESFKERFQQIKVNLNKPVKYTTITGFIGFICFGFVIYQGESKLYKNQDIKPETALINFKNEFKLFSKITNQPKIVAVDLKLDIFPKKQNFKANGSYLLVNKSNQKIDTLLIKTGFDEVSNYTLNIDFKLIKKSDYFNFKVLKLSKPLLPKDSIKLNFSVKNKENTLFERNSNVLKNGAFLKQDILPRFGYFLNNTIKKPTDSLAKINQLGSLDADFIDFSATISTSKNQMIISPGNLIKEWKSENRKFYQYKTHKKIKFSLAFISGDFDIKKEHYKNVDFEVYHHKNHHQNIDKMLNGLKASFDYNTKYFNNYQHKSVKVVEFPISEGVFATIMGNMIPTSERRFLANPNVKNQFDTSFKVQAHELTHHWWGNQLIHANALGAGLLSESITDYITLKIFNHQFGQEKKQQFLKYQRRRYLRGSVNDSNEKSLQLAQPKDVYLSYGKGSMALNTLATYLGEDKLNNTLKTFFDEFTSRKNQYPTSLDLIKKLKQNIPDSLQYLVGDYFENVIFYDAKLNKVKVNKDGNKYKIIVDFEYSKYLKNNKKNVSSLNDFIQIGFYDIDEKVITQKTIKVTKKENSISFLLDKKPAKVILDPNLLLIEKNIDNNIKTIYND
ncbi:M1 family aminopeptidase [Polaribacter porphyrae]|uniref:Peptidase M1 membrane alanine aminopeptidase domain-containing protein n=1 Tax=Polaribacter porphyrae TaxID=1137780 RepID=A0A2S7WK34_9FLAO|nr:M1 family aminopeptidase [Polaribacter porphyrae]PQJ77977.1 hypothetical protein BTO18_01700 [Polaribacter porphyrae]